MGPGERDVDRRAGPADADLRGLGRPHAAGHAGPAGGGGGDGERAGAAVRGVPAGDLAAPQGARAGGAGRAHARGAVAAEPVAGRSLGRGGRLAARSPSHVGRPDGPARGAPAPDRRGRLTWLTRLARLTRSASPASSTPRGSGCSGPGPTRTTWRSGSARRR